jgi:hypothetical protein
MCRSVAPKNYNCFSLPLLSSQVSRQCAAEKGCRHLGAVPVAIIQLGHRIMIPIPTSQPQIVIFPTVIAAREFGERRTLCTSSAGVVLLWLSQFVVSSGYISRKV